MMMPNYYQNLLLDLNNEDNHQLYHEEDYHIALKSNHASPSSSSSSISPSSPVSHIHLKLSQDRTRTGYKLDGSKLSLMQEEVIDDVVPNDAVAYDDVALESKREINGLRLTILNREGKNGNYDHHYDHHHQQPFGGTSKSSKTGSPSSVKWMPSKMRLMRKMMKGENGEATHTNATEVKFEDHNNFKQVASSSESSAHNGTTANSAPIRVCADCNTTRTPLWRSGPQGPKSLCNACGIRQRKARKAAMAAYCATNNNDNLSKSTLQKEQGAHEQMKKRSKSMGKTITARNGGQSRKVCFEEFALSLSKKLSLHQVFPPDEKEAAILLMALSCGLNC